MNIEYKRILIVNDDKNEEDFFKEYTSLETYRAIVRYCQDPVSAFECITLDGFGGCDKIILDIKLDWDIPEKYIDKINEYINVGEMKKQRVNNGFLIFMYLVSRGYPIDRIAFLSSYIIPEDSEFEKKEELLEMVEGFKKRDKAQDEKLVKKAGEVPSLSGRITSILGSPKYEGREAYEEIKKTLRKNMESSNKDQVSTNEELKNNEQFFGLLRTTGLRVRKKIDKGSVEKDKEVEEWIKSGEWESYYNFRNMVLNICEYVKDKTPAIYDLYKPTRYYTSFKQNYPKDCYFQALISKIKYEVLACKGETDTNRIMENIVSDLVSFWESLDKKYIDAEVTEGDINNHALTMVLKHTRNWYAHGRIEKLGIRFCKFIFLVSIRVIYGQVIAAEVLENYIGGKWELRNEKKLYKNMWKEINKSIIGEKKLKTNTCTINVADLYYKYSNEKARLNITLTTEDLYKMFILCLHFPDISIADTNDGEDNCRIVFNEIDYDKQEPYMIFLEKIAIDNLSAAESSGAGEVS